MISPIGFRPVLDIHALAWQMALGLASEAFDTDRRNLSSDEGSPEHLAEWQAMLSNYNRRKEILQKTMVDRFLIELPRIFVASIEGLILEVSKTVVLPNADEYLDDDDFLANRDAKYSCVDTEYWMIDYQKLEGERDRIRELVEPMLEYETVRYEENQRIFKYVKRFDGWSLCIHEADFPKTGNVLRDLLKQNPDYDENNKNATKKILALTNSGKLTKAEVKNHFPNLSARKFEFYWKLAAESNPELSKPGRKS